MGMQTAMRSDFDPQDMRNMGGLLSKMPRTGWTFIIGGLALSGFPIVTAGFWSKDEILADALVNNHRVVFVVLALAALLTAFYTARQISDGVLGQTAHRGRRRMPASTTAIFAWMTYPLMVLAVLCRGGRLGRHPPQLPVARHHFQQPVPPLHGRAGRGAAHRSRRASFQPHSPADLAGRRARWAGRRLGRLSQLQPRAETRPGPIRLVPALGRLYTVLQNKYYFDEFYYSVFVKGTQRLSSWLFRFDDLWVIDPIVDGVGKLGRRFRSGGVGSTPTSWTLSSMGWQPWSALSAARCGSFRPAGCKTICCWPGHHIGAPRRVPSDAEVSGGICTMNSWISVPLSPFMPLLGAILVLLPWARWFGWDKAREERLIKRGSTSLSMVPLVLAIVLWATYDKTLGGFQFQVDVPWISALGINYHVGVDGLSVPMIFLTTFLTTLGLWYSSNTIKYRVREFFFLFLLLEMGMLGVFMSLDLVLFYVFWEVGLVPMYFLIGIWGQAKDRPQYSAIKFFLYTLAGSVFMLLAILAIYFNTGTFDMIKAAAAQPFAATMSCSRAWLSWPSSSPSPSRCPAGRSTPGCLMPTPRRPLPARSSWPVSC